MQTIRKTGLPPTRQPGTPFRRGLTLLEVMFLLVIFTIVAVGISFATQALAKGPAAADQEQAISMEIVSELETYRTKTFATLAASTNISDTVFLKVSGGTRSYSRAVTFTKMDPNNPTTNASPQTDFLQVRVTIGDRTSILWVTQP